MVSMLVHSFLVLAALALMHIPRVEQPPLVRRSPTLVVMFQANQPHIEWSPESDTAQPAQQSGPQTDRSDDPLAASAPPSPAYRVTAPITLIRPDIPPNTSLPLKALFPQVTMWTPPYFPVETVVPPPPQIAAVNDVRPSLSMPNHELQVADIPIASTAAVSETIPILAATTSFIVAPGQAPPQVPHSASDPSLPPTLATVLSISDVFLAKGTVVLPPVNESAGASNSNTFAPGQPGGTSARGHGPLIGEQTGKQNGSESGATFGDHAPQNEAVDVPGANNSAKPTSNPGSDPGRSPANGASVDRITRPKDGHFGAVIVGDSVAEQYPEAAGIWADRLAYTVYLHLGAAKTWILQYCLPRTVEAEGNTARPDAPWPYFMVTPHPAPGNEDDDADSLLVHGFIDTAGHFETLVLMFPEPSPHTKSLLDALQQWQFRPAAQNGQTTAVEVLLIIPGQSD